MAIDLTLWSETFSRANFPRWPCPECEYGRLQLIDGTLRVVEPSYSKASAKHEDWEPEWVIERFSATLKCNDHACGEVVCVSGDTKSVQVIDEETGAELESQLRPRSIFPAPPILHLPKETPEPVASDIKAAFQLYWSDLSASSNRLRSSVERLLDHFQIAKRPAKGKNRFLPLAERLRRFKNDYPTHADLLEALRLVGNAGTHAGVSRSALLAAFQVYEEALAEIFGQRSKNTAKLARALTKSKGKLKESAVRRRAK